jgi:hypothetical protein
MSFKQVITNGRVGLVRLDFNLSCRVHYRGSSHLSLLGGSLVQARLRYESREGDVAALSYHAQGRILQ